MVPVKEKEERTEAEGVKPRRVRTPPFIQSLFGARRKVVPEKEETTEGAAERKQEKRVRTPPSLQGLGASKKVVPEKEKEGTAEVPNKHVMMKIFDVKTDNGYKKTLLRVELGKNKGVEQKEGAQGIANRIVKLLEKKEAWVAEADTEEGMVGTREKEEESVVEGVPRGETQGTNKENKSAKHEDEEKKTDCMQGGAGIELEKGTHNKMNDCF